MKKIKVCILQNGLMRGGTDTFVVNLCREIDHENFDVTVVNPDPNKALREPEIMTTGTKVAHTSPIAGLGSTLRHFIRLYRLLRKERFDVFHTNIDLFNGPNLLVAWLAGVPMRICHSHNTSRGRDNGIKNTLYIKAMRRLCKMFSNRVTGCSKEAVEFIFPGYKSTDEHFPLVIYNGIDLDAFKSSINRSEKRRQLGIPEGKKAVLTVGRMCYQKNSKRLLEIFAAAHKDQPDLLLVWVGIGSWETEIKERAAALGLQDDIIFLGGRDDVAEIMQSCDIFFLPSVFEGLGIVLVEAQAAGLTCVASDSIPALADCGGVDFVSLDSDDTAWARHLINAANGVTTKESAPELLENFSMQNTARQMERVFSV